MRKVRRKKREKWFRCQRCTRPVNVGAQIISTDKRECLKLCRYCTVGFVLETMDVLVNKYKHLIAITEMRVARLKDVPSKVDA